MKSEHHRQMSYGKIAYYIQYPTLKFHLPAVLYEIGTEYSIDSFYFYFFSVKLGFLILAFLTQKEMVLFIYDTKFVIRIKRDSECGDNSFSFIVNLPLYLVYEPCHQPTRSKPVLPYSRKGLFQPLPVLK